MIRISSRDTIGSFQSCESTIAMVHVGGNGSTDQVMEGNGGAAG